MNIEAKPRILVVDDEPVMRSIAESVLTEHGFDVSPTESAEEAIAMIADGLRPDLVLLDVLMPGMNGFEACRVLRRMRNFEYLPIIMLTALDDQKSIDEAYSCGATDFITKPLNIALLPHRVRYLLRSSTAFRDLVENQVTLLNTQQIAHLGNWTMDPEGDITSASQEFLDMIGATALPVAADRLIDAVHHEDRPLLLRHRAELPLGQAYQMDYRLRSFTDDGRWQHVHERGFPRFDDRNRHVATDGFTQDITERVAQEEQIRHLAWHDPVTGLNNRARLGELIERELENGDGQQNVTLLFIQIANLRHISTVLGQDVADTVIRALAGRLTGLLESPAAEVFPGRLAGIGDAKLARHDEHAFVIALPVRTDKEDIYRFARTIHEALGQPLLANGEDVIATTFIGIAFYPDDADEVGELMRRAMLVALQAARGEGPAIGFFDIRQDNEASERMALERALRSAIELGGQLQPYFQPKICTRSGQIVGAEVLLRWQRPGIGMVSPGEFIPLAEESGLIHPISEWLISHVFDLIAYWVASGNPPCPISINLSAESFFRHSLVPFIDRQLERTGIPASILIVELTETVLMQNADTAQQVIGALRNRGIRISLDDFGTGFSSLGYLNRFSIDEIKIDQSFITNLEGDNKKVTALVQAIISLGHALSLKVVAEGIETQPQANLLRQMGCDIFQGFYFARPMPAQDFSTFLCNSQAGQQKGDAAQ